MNDIRKASVKKRVWCLQIKTAAGNDAKTNLCLQSRHGGVAIMRILSLVVETSVFLPTLRPHLCLILCIIKNPGRKSLMPNLEISFPYLIHCLKRKLSFRFQSMYCALAVLSVLESFRFSTKPMHLKVLQLLLTL